MSLPPIPTVCQHCGASLIGNCHVELGERTPLSIDVVCRNWSVAKATWCGHVHEVI